MRQQGGTVNPGTSKLKVAQPRLRGLAGEVAVPGYAAMLAWSLLVGPRHPFGVFQGEPASACRPQSGKPCSCTCSTGILYWLYRRQNGLWDAADDLHVWRVSRGFSLDMAAEEIGVSRRL